VQILVDMNGVLRGASDEPIGTGILMIGTLSVYNRLTFMSNSPESEMKLWLNSNKIVDYDFLMDSSIHLEGEELAERQIKMARAKGPVDLFITNNPTLWAFAFELGIPAVMFGVPSYTRPEFRPDAPKKKRAWNEIEEAINKQNILRTEDARLSRTEALNFE
jgi:hypothetical protein